MNYWLPYLISFCIGLLVGIEREKAHPKQQTMGVRTFILICLLGSISGGLQNTWMSIVLSAFALGLILISYFTQTRSIANVDRGLTTEFAAGLVFCLGYTSHQTPALSALIGPIVALVLFSKTKLHHFTHIIKNIELEAALLLLLTGVVVISLVPDALVDPWGIFNPKKFGYIILTLATLEFSSYILIKLVGSKKGALINGFLGGLVSSTSVLLATARQATKTPSAWRTLLSSALIAKLAALLELLLIVALVSWELFIHLVFPVGAGVICGGIALLIIIPKHSEDYDSRIVLKSPLNWKGVLRLSLLLAIILAAISITKIWLGVRATFALSFLTGMFELHGVSLANATMYVQGHLTMDAAIISVTVAIFASFFAKLATAWIINHGAYARGITLAFLIMMVAIGLSTWLTI